VRENATLRDKLGLITFFRVGAAVVLLFVVFVLEAKGSISFQSPVPREMVYTAISFLLAFCVISFISLERIKTDKGATWLAYSQFGMDALFSTAMVVATGGYSSGFTFLYSLSVINASLVLYRGGAIFSAAVQICCLALVGLGQGGILGSGVNRWLLEANWLGGGQVETEVFGDIVSALALNIVALISVAWLSAFLAEQMREADARALAHRRRLVQLTNLHENLVLSLEAALITLDTNLDITYVNPSACSMLGLSRDALTGKNLSSILPDLHGAMASGSIPKDQHFEESLVRGGKVSYLRWSVSSFRDEEGNRLGHTLIAFDITRMKEMEEAVERSKRLAALGRLAASIAHEIRNPLASLSGSIQLLSSSITVDGSDRRLMEIVVREADHLNRWISEFLEYAKPTPLMPQWLDLRDLVDGVADFLRNDERFEGIALEIESPSEVKYFGDGTRIRQVVWNLALNALQAVSTDVEAKAAGPRVVVKVEDGVELVRVSVLDNGPGIPGDIQHRVFEPFFTTKSDGTGLGLATVMRHVVELKGKMSLRGGLEGRGAAVIASLPRLKPEEYVSASVEGRREE